MRRTDLPTGTVTFLFTDVEGSTQLLHDLGAEAYAAALAEHRRVIREACERHGGVEVDTQGDAFFFAFPRAPGALAAAAELTEALRSGPIRVRAAVHTGTPLVTDEGYVGADVHRAARIAAAGHGGQVLVSAATAALLDSATLRDLGEHRFKDLAAAERVYQLAAGEFPPLASLYRTNLPVPATPFLGRGSELAEVVELLHRDDVRLVTLTGPGGTGKTRLALQAAAETAELFPDGVWWVPLASLRDPALVLPALALSLDVKERPDRPLAGALADALAGRRALLLLDNVEHLLPDVASEVARLRDLDGPTVLVTTRERLQLQGEHVWAVPSLSDDDGFALFASRARALQSAFRPTRAVAELCSRLDNLPLALELAAARTVVFSPEQLLERLGERLDLLKGGRDADPRQQTLRATIEWSYQLLDESERQLLRRLSVFVGGCTYDGAEQVADADPDTLQSLIDKSLIRRRDTDVGARYWMLETIREFAAEGFAASEEADRLRRRHAHYFLRLAEAASDPDQPAPYLALEAERADFRLALSSFRDAGDDDLGLRLAAALGRFWRVRGPIGEGRRSLEDALSRTATPTPARARALSALSDLLYLGGEPEAGVEVGTEAVALARRLGDVDAEELALQLLGNAASAVPDFALARSSFEQCAELSRELGRVASLSASLTNLAELDLFVGDRTRARARLEESLALAREIGNAQRVSHGLLVLAVVETRDRRFGHAREALVASLELARQLGLVNYQTWLLGAAAELAAAVGRYDRSARLLGASSASETFLGLATDPFDEMVRRDVAEAVRAALGEHEFDRAYGEGSDLTLDAAVECVLAS